MSPESQNAINSTARAAVKEYTNKSNTLTYRPLAVQLETEHIP